jgi:hypothetical protein
MLPLPLEQTTSLYRGNCQSIIGGTDRSLAAEVGHYDFEFDGDSIAQL